MIEQAFLIVVIYLSSIFIIIVLATITEHWKQKKLSEKIYTLLLKNELDDKSLAALLRKNKIKRRNAINALNEVYLTILLEESDADERKRKKNLVHELLLQYEKEMSFPELPQTVLDKIQLLRTQSYPTEELITQLSYAINDIYLSERKHKRFSTALTILGLILTVISFFPNFFNLFK